MSGERGDDAYRRAEPQASRPPLTLRWSYLSGCMSRGALGFLAIFVSAVAVTGTLDVLRAREPWWQRGVTGLVLLVVYAFLFFLLVVVLGTGGVTIDRSRRRIVRFGGALFVPLRRSTHRLDADATVRVESRSSGRGRTPIVTYTAILVSGDRTIELQDFEDRARAEEQAQRVRDHLAD